MLDVTALRKKFGRERSEKNHTIAIWDNVMEDFETTFATEEEAEQFIKEKNQGDRYSIADTSIGK